MRKLPYAVAAAAFAAVSFGGLSARAEDTSAPAILSWFDGSYRSQELRAGDVFRAGYGAVWLPPPGRADSGNGSVGYDVYDRFDLGGPRNPTLYGTETGLKAAVGALHRANVDVHLDYVANHNGFNDQNTPNFAAAGGYPGFFLQTGTDQWGDFHAPNATGDRDGRISGLIDIDHSKNHRAIRNPVPGFANNLPAGTVPRFGRLANVPTETNRRFYPDRDVPPAMVINDPATGESNIPIYRFTPSNPMGGDPVEENATGYLMRNAQWLVQVVGVDGFRIDAAKHFEPWFLNYFDRAVYRSNPRTLLDGSQKQVFSYSEVFDGSRGFLQGYVRKDINPANPSQVGGNRDVLDFPQFFALRDNLTKNGIVNDWRNVVNAGMDVWDDGRHNGSQGVLFAASHDEFGPYLSNVAHAYMLMQPGNAVVYFNGKEHGNNRDFPKDGRGDALGGQYGDRITRLVELRNEYGRGNFRERLLEKEVYAYERSNSAIVLLSNRGDAGYDSRTINTDFRPGTYLVELTGNASNPSIDPNDDLPQVVQVQANGTVNVRIPRNVAPNGNQHNSGYLIYGPQAPQGKLSLYGISLVLPAQVPTPDTNGSARLTDVHVVTGDTLGFQLKTNAVNLLGSIRDRDADGDSAVYKIDGGIDLNRNGRVDFVTPGSVVYGFEQFTGRNVPGYNQADGSGVYEDTVNVGNLSEGFHFLEVRAFRHRDDGGPAVYSTFKRTIYMDQRPPESGVERFGAPTNGSGAQRELIVRSLDQTADNVHVFWDLPPGLSEAQIFAMLGSGSQSEQVDRDLWAKQVSGLANGNHAATVVTFEMTGTSNLQRFGGLFVDNGAGLGFGDMNADGLFAATDVQGFADIVLRGANLFNPAGDVNGDAFVNGADVALFRQSLVNGHAGADVLGAFDVTFGGITFVPEPTGTAVVLFVGGWAVTRRQRRSPCGH